MKKKKDNEISIRSSAAEYLTYVAAIGDNPESIEVRYEDEKVQLLKIRKGEKNENLICKAWTNRFK